MKANVLLPALLTLTLLNACAPTAAPPAAAPQPVETPSPAPAPLPAPAADWRDAPLTPGTWRWSAASGQSAASFERAGEPPLVVLRCAAPGTIQLTHAAAAATQPTPLAVTTSSGTFPLMTDPVIAGTSSVAVTLPARAPVLDAMAYSRGRFVIEVAGLAPSYLPAWPEVARVIEDCR
ncbi:MAG: hypothetical protein ACKOW1_08640 [Novosphingobium sp.]